MPNIFGDNHAPPPGVPIPPGPQGPQGPQGPPGPAAIQEEGVSLPARGYLNFVGTGVTAADDAANNRVTVTVTGGGGGATPGGPDTSIQVHNAGVLTGYSTLTFDGQQLIGTVVNPSDAGAWTLNCTTDNLSAPADFSSSNGLCVQEIVTGGYYGYDGTIGAKSTTFAGYFNLYCMGASQAFALGVVVQKDAMGDSGAVNGSVSFRGGPLSGDEGQCYQCTTYLQQDYLIITHTITAVRRSGCLANLTVTQVVTASKNPQTVTVSGTTGLAVNDWLVAGQSPDTGPQHIRAIQVISFTATSITAVFAVNMVSGDSLKAALVLTLDDTYKMGQLIPIVNLSGTTYSTGTVSAISDATFAGTGTAWAANVVGGDSLNIGAVSLVADNDTEPNGTNQPFDNVPPESGGHMLRSWYQILQVADAAHLDINSYTVAGNRDYRGNGPGSGGYLIRPAARALWFPGGRYGREVVCEYSAHAWSVGHIVESTICPYPDVQLQQWSVIGYTPGGSYRSGIMIKNGGHRTFEAGIKLTTQMTGGDIPWAWTDGINLDNCKNGVHIYQPLESSIHIYNYSPETYNSDIIWDGNTVGRIGISGNTDHPGNLSFKGWQGPTVNFVGLGVGIVGVLGYPELRLAANIRLKNNGNPYPQFYEISAGTDPDTLRAWRMEADVNAADTSLFFHYINQSPSSGVSDNLVFSVFNLGALGGYWGGIALPKIDVATDGTNYGSREIMFRSSVWHAGAAQDQFAVIDIRPESGAHDAQNVMRFILWDSATGYNTYSNEAMLLTSVGVLSLGNKNVGRGGGFYATFDPTGVSANRTLTVPDASGVIALSGPTSTYKIFPTETDPASGLVSGYPGTWGSRFQVTHSVIVSALGRLYIAANTLDHFIGLWNADTHTLLASGTILNATASDSHGFKNVAVIPVLLVPGVKYTVASTEHAADGFKQAFDCTPMVSAVISPDCAMYDNVTSDVEPLNPGSPGYSYVGHNLTFADAPGAGLATFDAMHLTVPRVITIPDASGTMSLLPLPSASPGSGKLWYDPADSNRVKYTP